MEQPEIRFNGFNDEWVEKKLGESEIRVATGKLNANAATVNGKYPFFTTALETYMTDSYSFDDDAILVAGNGNLGFVKEYSGKFDAYQREYVLTNFEGYVKSYLVSYFKYSLSNHISHSSKGSAMPYITKDVLESFLIVSPSLSEQQKIGALFSKYDAIIVLREQKLEELNALKKGLLQQMFDDGHKLQVRFSGFNDEWVEKKLGDIGYSKSGVGFPVSEQGGSTGHPFYKVSDMNINGNDIKLVSSNNYVSDNQIRLKNWKLINTVPAIVFAKVGAALLLNRKRIVEHPFLIDNNLMAYIFDKSWDIYFGKTWFDIVDLPKYAQTGALPSYNSSDIERIHVLRPSFPEQQKIGQLFKRLDDRILNEQSKIEQLKEQKQGLLQRML